MTPFGERLRELRAERGMTQKQMAQAIGVSPAYLSALEHGKRGVPRWILVQDIIACLNIIWDEADELQRLAMHSAPKVTIDTTALSPKATELANLLASGIDVLGEEALEDLRLRLDAAIRRAGR
ncbi:helix-turn-helix domain-containing protein [Roseitalea porphyridii]|uniref:Helix-turn-helix domain-containing protein n=1 Tax=Roseitalea porphyridii TaxID=1852022 RepID=A0A4P6UXQ7_9HYPH|nr:helix-turn-helix domain-containing protein [Roseitalea porphyridii]QBK29273.1 helix-turn-helix domain-containing protein [Roseitalea porphyridii]